MRFIFKLALGMIIFNAMLIMLGSYFPTHSTYSTKDVTSDATVSTWGNLDEGTITGFIISGAEIFIAIILAGGILKLAGFTLPIGMFIGAGIVITLFLTLWLGYTSPIVGISKDMGIYNWYNLFMILFGIIIMMSVAEIFTGKGDIDA